MEDRLMFDRIHEALDVELPPGAYERLRIELTKKPVRSFRWPAFPTRWSKMGFKLAAGVALIALAAATAAAILAIHNASNNGQPAGSRMSITAYERMIAIDAPDPNKVWTAACDEATHTGCTYDATRSIPLLQNWLNDINRPGIPDRFVVVNVEMRQHLRQSLTALQSLLADSRSGDQAAMTRDYIVAVYGVDWTGTVVPGIAASQQVNRTAYLMSVRQQLQALDSCMSSGCTLILSSQASNCTTNGGVPCVQLFDSVAVNYATFAAALVQFAAPQELFAKDAALQGDLAQADSALLHMRLAVGAADQSGINSGVAQLKRIAAQIDRDANKILQS